MNCNLVLDIHLIKLVNTADAMVGKHQSACLDAKFTCLWVFTHTCSKTCGVRCFAGAVDGSGHKLTHVLEELALRSSRVANDTNVDIST